MTELRFLKIEMLNLRERIEDAKTEEEKKKLTDILLKTEKAYDDLLEEERQRSEEGTEE